MPTPEAIIEALKVTMENIDDVKLYFKLKQYRAKYMHNSTDLLKACIALDQLGLNITTAIVKALTTHTPESLSGMLHNLGDKHFLVLKRRRGRYYEWLLHPTFKALLYERTDHANSTELGERARNVERDGDALSTQAV